MPALRDISIKWKLRGLVMVAVLTAMSLSCTAFVVNDVRLMQNDMFRQLTALADVVGANTTAALTFDDSATAAQLLSSLRMQPMVTYAVLYDIEGNVFATYPEGQYGVDAPAPAKKQSHRLVDGYLEVFAPIRQDGDRIGTIYIRGNTDLIHRELLYYAAIVAVVMIVSFGASYLLASRLQRVISQPILALARAAQQISRANDYSIRVTKAGDDELGILYDEFNHMLGQIETGKQELEEAHGELEMRVEERTEQLSNANQELSKEVTERRRAEKELERVHGELMDSARRAGMAEIATGVLHNVGNVLNSVNVSAEMLANRLRASKRNHLNRLVAMLEEHRHNLAEFITDDEKGKQIPDFLKVLAEHLQAEEQSMLEESRSLTDNVDHVKRIISTQQSYAGVSGMVEPIDVNALLDDAVRLDSSSFDRHRIQIKCEYADVPTLLADKQRLLQIIVNLVKNAKEAMIERQGGERVLTMRTKTDDDRLVIEICDTGVGIEKEKLTRVFSHGFTTKTTGHGFGLHSCANAATEMHGSLSVQSDGRLKGATFILNLPLTLAAVNDCAQNNQGDGFAQNI